MYNIFRAEVVIGSFFYHTDNPSQILQLFMHTREFYYYHQLSIVHTNILLQFIFIVFLKHQSPSLGFGCQRLAGGTRTVRALDGVCFL